MVNKKKHADLSFDEIMMEVLVQNQTKLVSKTQNKNLVDIITFANDFLNVDFSNHPYLQVVLKLFYVNTVGNDNITIDQADIDLLKQIKNYNPYMEGADRLEDEVDEDVFLGMSEEDKAQMESEIETLTHQWGGNYWLGGKIELLRKLRKNPFHYLVMPLGRRSGKTFIASIIVCYESYKLLRHVCCKKCKMDFNLQSGEPCPHCGEKLINHPQSYYGVAPLENLRIVLGATKQGQAIDPMLNYVESFMVGCNFFKGKYTRIKDAIFLKSEFDEEYSKSLEEIGQREFRGSIVIKTVGGNVKGQHGMGSILTILDEFALFNKELEGADTDAAILEALEPASLLYRKRRGDGRLVLISMPDKKEGKFWEFFHTGIDPKHENYSKYLVVQMPTWEYNIEYPREYLESEYSFSKESEEAPFHKLYGAQFTDYTEEKFLNPSCLSESIDRRMRILEKPISTVHKYWMHLDAAGTGNANYAYLIGHWEVMDTDTDRPRKVFKEDRSFFWKTSNKKTGMFEGSDFKQYNIAQLLEEIIRVSKLFNIGLITCDLIQSMESEYLLRQAGIRIEKINYSGVNQGNIYGNLEHMFLDDRVRLCYDDYMLISELKNLRRIMRPNGRGMKISVSEKAEVNTKDLADCLAGVIYYSHDKFLGRQPGMNLGVVRSVGGLPRLGNTGGMNNRSGSIFQQDPNIINFK